MTAEDLALMGYLVPSQAQGAAPAPTAADLASIGMGHGIGYQMAGQMGLDAPTLAQFAPQASQGIAQFDPGMMDMMNNGTGRSAPAPTPQDLAAMSNSDPNGFTTNRSQSMPDPATLGIAPASTGVGSPGQDPTAANAGNVGASGNPETNAFIPGGAADQGGGQQQAGGDAPGTETAPNQSIATSLGFPDFPTWCKEAKMPRQVMPDERKVILEKYLTSQENFLSRHQPMKDQKPNPTSMAQLQDGTLGRVDNVTGKFTPVTDAQGNIIKGALKGNDAMMQQLGQIGQQAPAQPAASSWHIPFFGNNSPAPVATPSAVPGPTPYNPGRAVQAPAAAPHQQQAPVDAAGVKAAYKSGKMDRATAVALLKQGGF